VVRPEPEAVGEAGGACDVVALERLERAVVRLSPARRTSDSVTFVYVEHGYGSLERRAARLPVEPQQAFLIAPGEPHGLAGLRTAGGWLLEFAPEVVGMPRIAGCWRTPSPEDPHWLSFLRPAALAPRLDVLAPHAEQWSERLSEMEHELASRRIGYVENVVASLTRLLIDAARIALPSVEDDGLRSQPLMASVFDVIERRFSEPISLQNIAHDLAVSPGHLARGVKRSSGETVMYWLFERRMVAARALLQETDLTVESVAKRTGFRDLTNFRRQFRRSNGLSPADWRRVSRGNGTIRATNGTI
jgi:AraC family transcriptional regulator, transcriptional activator of pobA